MTDLSYINSLSDKAIFKEIGNFVQQRRIKMKMTQNELAERAAISRSTLSLIERGGNIALKNLIKILRTLDALYVFGMFKVEDDLSPLQLAKGERIKRKRVRTRSDNDKQKDPGW
ncbi:helix-turn-helix domain-containing protein [Sinomicrobium soli]|uniref:helix-turn-helix domain-containing protein n=1 Tax=Sinomicrobium sp. N-1-3-6 TaxID=2219864 RepID=UPI000DCD7F2A|nr:helix-turn-helix transcriptional regulator [Sinomicrobium sp. N-1-3-6]RAV29892.1 transcriptional regulator [Sinomicrobium sp. N-1-3-6]